MANEFVLESALQEAEMRLADRCPFALDPAQRDAFVIALAAPPEVNALLERLFHEPSVFDREI